LESFIALHAELTKLCCF